MKLLKIFLATFVVVTGLSSSVIGATDSAADNLQSNLNSKELFLERYDNKTGNIDVIYNWDKPATVYALTIIPGESYSVGRDVMTLKIPGRSKAHVKLAFNAKIISIGETIVTGSDRKQVIKTASTIMPGTVLFTVKKAGVVTHNSTVVTNGGKGAHLPAFSTLLEKIWQSTGIYDVYRQTFADPTNTWSLGIGRVIMIFVGIVLLILAIGKGFEPLLLLPIGFGAILSNIPLAGISGPDGLLGLTYEYGVANGLFPLVIFMGVGAMTDFGPLIANPKTALLGAAAQFGIFFALIGALLLGYVGVDFDLLEASSIGIIGGADGPTSIYLTSKLAPHLLGPIAVAAYSYMALVPIIQPPIMKLLTTEEDRKIKMKQLRHVSKLEKISFSVIITLLCAALLPDAAPLIGMLMFGNLMKESMVVERLSDTAQNSLINIVTIFLGLTVGSKLSADKFLNAQTLGILILGLAAFCVGTAAGVLFGQIMKKMSGGKVNPLIGAAGVSAVPMAARVVNKVGLEADQHNFLLMHAMGPNVAGVIGSAVAAGVMLNACKLLGVL